LKAFVAALLAAGCLLALPSAATAVTYTVNSTGDAPDNGAPNGVCETATAGECTLRAAIAESNNSTGVPDEIKFAAAFNGQAADTITALTLLPAITDPVAVKGESCTQLSQAGPCAGVDAPGLNYALSIENADGVAVEGLAVTGGLTGIRVVNSSQNFVARNNWLGVKLEGVNGTGANTGIWLDPDSNGATIGGTEATQRNVFANSAAEGLDIEGADNTDVLGNYFGVKPDGLTQAANGKNIEITDTDAFAATGNEVGTTIIGAAAPCDGGCNVISGGTTGIDLNGEPLGNEEPATGPTTIHGNYVGLSADGTTVVANGTFDVLVGKAEDALVGGVANGDANFIAGGGFGIYNENGEGFEAEGNIIGSGPSGADVTAPGTGIFVLNTNNTEQVVVNDNVIEMDGGVGVEARFGGTEIDGNFIEGAELGIWTKVAPNAAGSNLIEDNVIGESSANGIRIEDNANLVFGNSIYDSGAAGIRIQNPAALVNATENQIGGDTPDSENNIRESGGDAIEIDNSGGEGASFNEVARNRGEENGGAFIDLIGPLTNGGILPPAFATALQSSASGAGAEPGATVRVFRKANAEAGELQSFLAEAVADGSGNWSVTYPQVPTGTIVSATQTGETGGTSELATATAAADPSNGGGGGTGGGNDKGKDPVVVCMPLKPGPCPGGSDTKAPQTKILKGPKGKVAKATVKFKFSSSEKGSSFRCKLDRGPYRVCRSPKKYKNLKPGKHVFKVRAVDKAGNIDSTAAKRKFRVLG
jgi:hypothetical protein